MSDTTYSTFSDALKVATFTTVLAVTNAAGAHSSRNTSTERIQLLAASDNVPVRIDTTAGKAITEVVGKNGRKPFVPKTEMGKALWSARQRIIASGEPLEDPRELLKEFARSRQSW